MPKITLDILSNVNSNRNNANVFTDLHLDLTVGNTYNDQLYKQQQILDVQADTNLAAIYNSIRSIITTSPGQKPLNPVFGVGFGDLLFQQVTPNRGRSIGEAIFQGIQRYEPRVNIINVNVIPDSDNNQYTIELTVTVPRFNTQQVKIVGTLDKTGFYYSNN
jgi:phage baseplate assembly protein W